MAASKSCPSRPSSRAYLSSSSAYWKRAAVPWFRPQYAPFAPRPARRRLQAALCSLASEPRRLEGGGQVTATVPQSELLLGPLRREPRQRCAQIGEPLRARPPSCRLIARGDEELLRRQRRVVVVVEQQSLRVNERGGGEERRRLQQRRLGRLSDVRAKSATHRCQPRSLVALHAQAAGERSDPRSASAPVACIGAARHIRRLNLPERARALPCSLPRVGEESVRSGARLRRAPRGSVERRRRLAPSHLEESCLSLPQCRHVGLPRRIPRRDVLAQLARLSVDSTLSLAQTLTAARNRIAGRIAGLCCRTTTNGSGLLLHRRRFVEQLVQLRDAAGLG